MSASTDLRARTNACHEQVDAAFGSFRLAEPLSYRAFLTAHARALGGAEAALLAMPDLPAWRPRMPLLAQDLADLSASVPSPLFLDVQPGAAGWGALYVTEGSRLGGAMLARDVASGLPRRYLDAAFEAGEWRALRGAIDAEASARGEAWLAAAVAGAEACFALYRQAAAMTVSEADPRSVR
jgi:heme oxygenase